MAHDIVKISGRGEYLNEAVKHSVFIYLKFNIHKKVIKTNTLKIAGNVKNCF